jgi:hypothetical protein
MYYQFASFKIKLFETKDREMLLNQELLYASKRTFEELFQSAVDRAMLLLESLEGRRSIIILRTPLA